MHQIDAAVAAGADAVKFQAGRPRNWCRSRGGERLPAELGFDWFDRLKSKELTRDDLRALAAYAAATRHPVLRHAHDAPSLAFVGRELQVPPLIKVGSGEAHNRDSCAGGRNRYPGPYFVWLSDRPRGMDA